MLSNDLVFVSEGGVDFFFMVVIVVWFTYDINGLLLQTRPQETRRVKFPPKIPAA